MHKIKAYNYVGADEIRQSVVNAPIGTAILSISDLKAWIDSTSDKRASAANFIVATFVIDRDGNLRLAERHSEHIACAGGQAVLSAGEIFISWDKNSIEVSDITNQSTGFCPELASWKYVEYALDKLSIERPSHFTHKFTFRRCDYCAQINIIKDDMFICQVCNSDLSDKWNF